jgi:hypothetical protein
MRLTFRHTRIRDKCAYDYGFRIMWNNILLHNYEHFTCDLNVCTQTLYQRERSSRLGSNFVIKLFPCLPLPITKCMKTWVESNSRSTRQFIKQSDLRKTISASFDIIHNSPLMNHFISRDLRSLCSLSRDSSEAARALMKFLNISHIATH